MKLLVSQFTNSNQFPTLWPPQPLQIHRRVRHDGRRLGCGGRDCRALLPHHRRRGAAARCAVHPPAQPLPGAAPQSQSVVRRWVRRLPRGPAAGLLPRACLAGTCLSVAARRRHPLRPSNPPPLGFHDQPYVRRRHAHFHGKVVFSSTFFPCHMSNACPEICEVCISPLHLWSTYTTLNWCRIAHFQSTYAESKVCLIWAVPNDLLASNEIVI